MIRRPPRSTQSRSSAASDVYKRQVYGGVVQALDGRTHSDGAGGEQQGVIRQGVGVLPGRDGDLLGVLVDAGDPVAGALVQVQGRGQGRGGVQQERISLGDLAGEVVGQAAVGKGDV